MQQPAHPAQTRGIADYGLHQPALLQLLQLANHNPDHLLTAAAPQPLLQQATRAEIINIGQRLVSDAQAFFATATPESTVFDPRSIEPDSAPEVALTQLLQQHSGLVIGTSPQMYSARRLLVEHLELFEQRGVRTLYLNTLLADAHQRDLDHYDGTADHAAISIELQRYLEHLPGQQRYSWLELLRQAHRHGIRLVALDTSVRKLLENQPALLATLPAEAPVDYIKHPVFNYLAQLIIHEQQSQPGSGKWLAIMDARQASAFKQTPGVAALTGVPTLRISVNEIASAQSPRFIQQDCGALFKTHRTHEWNWLQGNLLLTDRPTPSAVELNALLLANSGLNSTHFTLRALPDSDALEMRYASAGEIVRRRVRQQTDLRWSIENRNPIRFEIGQTQFANLSALIAFLTAQSWIPLDQHGIPPWSIRDAQQRKTLAARFAQRRHEVLWHMAWFASATERQQFKQGRDSYRLEQTGADIDLSDISALGLACADLSELKQAFADSVTPWHQEQLSPREQGALLAAIHQLQARQLAQHAARWQMQIARLGAQRILPLAHNIYLAATDHRQGLCSALAAQVASAWMLERRAGQGLIERWQQRLTAASTAPGTTEARVLDLGLLEWSTIEAHAKFGNFLPRILPDLDAVLRVMNTAPHGAAYQLSLGHHAVSLGVARSESEVLFFVADPNYGYVEFNGLEALHAGLSFQEKRWRALFPGAQEERAFGAGYSLRRYRRDLPTQPLFVHRGTAPGTALRLEDLSQETPLGRMFGPQLELDRSFRALQRRLTLAEYRACMLPPSGAGLPLNPRLQQIFVRHRGQENLQQLVQITVDDRYAWLRFRRTPTAPIEELVIDGRHHAEDLHYLQSYDRFWQRLTRARHHGELGLELDTLFLTAALIEA
jgi:hypothetical protein